MPVSAEPGPAKRSAVESSPPPEGRAGPPRRRPESGWGGAAGAQPAPHAPRREADPEELTPCNRSELLRDQLIRAHRRHIGTWKTTYGVDPSI